MSDNTLVIMAKRPVAGRVKTRLARDIGTAQALRFYRAQLARTCRDLTDKGNWRTLLAVSPDHWKPELRVNGVTPQGRGDLGRRMQHLFDQCAKGRLIIIGADIPGITPTMIRRAFSLLKGHDAVFGPASDGGYWLVGQRCRPSFCICSMSAFDPVRWSSPHALADTLNNLKGRSIAFVDELRDVDTGDDHSTFLESISRRE